MQSRLKFENDACGDLGAVLVGAEEPRSHQVCLQPVGEPPMARIDINASTQLETERIL